MCKEQEKKKFTLVEYNLKFAIQKKRQQTKTVLSTNEHPLSKKQMHYDNNKQDQIW